MPRAVSMKDIGITMRDKNYQRLLGSKTWKHIRANYLSKHPLCEDCELKGITRLATEVHHVTPISDGMDYERMRLLAYNANNLRALCHDCHRAIHEADGCRFNKKKIRERHSANVAAFVEEYLTPPADQERGE